MEGYILISCLLVAGTFLHGRAGAWLLPLALLPLQLWWGLLAPVGAVVLAVYIATTVWMLKPSLPHWVQWSLRGLWLAISVALVMHAVPGMHNLPMVTDTALKPGSVPTAFYWNIDKVWVAWSLGTYVMALWRPSGPVVKTHGFLAGVVALGGIVLTLLWGWGSGLLAWQPAVPAIFWLFAAANLLNTCFAEELLFRGVIQNWLVRRSGSVPLGLLAASALFGLVHLPLSATFALGAFIAGLCYGAVYLLSRRLWVAVLCHWGLNLAHILLFTYPLAA